MCGIAGLFLKDPKLHPDLGAMLTRMLAPLCDRGPDSAGFAVYGAEVPGCTKITVRAEAGATFDTLFADLKDLKGAPFQHQIRDTHCTLVVPVALERAVTERVRAAGSFSVVGVGRHMELFKEVGRPDEVAKRFDLSKMKGTHAIGHTRMATESAVTTKGAHPFTTGPDQCLVHNGSLSNHNAVRRELIAHGLTFETENDSEVAAGFISWELHKGRSLSEAMTGSLSALDGFYTFVIGTESGFGVLRDPIACKPAVMAETDGWVAFGTEYRALVDLPGIDSARVWEPEPARVYLWERH
jgi:methylamine---glutamate N-methyltransferase subunit A